MNLKIKFELEETELKGEIENLVPSSGGSLPSGGTTGQILTKNSDEDGDAGWKDNNFVVTESGISKALGYVPRKAWYVNINVETLNNVSSDKTPDEIYQAYTDGYVVYAVISADLFGVPFMLPLLAAFSTNGNYTLLFGASADPKNNGSVQFTLAWNERWYIRYDDLVNETHLGSMLSNKLDKNQGTSNSGKFLGIGADGIVVPTEVGGGGGSDRLIAKYVHSGNPVIQPTALDLETGVFTCEGHGLTTGDTVIVIPDGPYRSIPFELCSTMMISSSRLTVRVIDDSTFVLRNGSSDVVFTNAINTTIDVSEFHIEKTPCQRYVIEGFSEDEVEIRISGFAWGTNNYYLAIFGRDATGKISSLFKNNSNYTCNNVGQICPFYDVKMCIGKQIRMDARNINAPTSSADYTYIQTHYTLMGYKSRSKVVETFYVYPARSHGKITSLLLSCGNDDSYNINLMLANGFTVEVYKLG